MFRNIDPATNAHSPSGKVDAQTRGETEYSSLTATKPSVDPKVEQKMLCASCRRPQVTYTKL